MAAKKKEPLCLSEFSNSAIEAEANHRGLMPELDIEEFTDGELLDEMADRGILPEAPAQEPVILASFTSEDLFKELLGRPDVNSRQTGLSVRLDIQVGGKPVCKGYGPTTVLWKRD